MLLIDYIVVAVPKVKQKHAEFCCSLSFSDLPCCCCFREQICFVPLICNQWVTPAVCWGGLFRDADPHRCALSQQCSNEARCTCSWSQQKLRWLFTRLYSLKGRVFLDFSPLWFHPSSNHFSLVGSWGGMTGVIPSYPQLWVWGSEQTWKSCWFITGPPCEH